MPVLHAHCVRAVLKSGAAGYVDGIDDPGMGWARYAQTIRIFVLNSGLFYIQPSERTVRLTRARASAWRTVHRTHAVDSQLSLMDRITGYLKTVKAWDQTACAHLVKQTPRHRLTRARWP